MGEDKPVHVSEITGPLIEHLKSRGIDVDAAPERTDAEREDRDPVSDVRPDLVPESWCKGRGIPTVHSRRLYSEGELLETRALKTARRFMAPEVAREERYRFLVLAGPPGTGKSLAAAWICACAFGHASSYPGAWWCKAEELVQAKRNGWRKGETPATSLRHVERAGTLVVDDLGEEFADAAGFAKHTIQSTITGRYDDGRKRLVITTNLEQAPFASRYGSRVMDRLEGSGAWIDCRGETLRGR